MGRFQDELDRLTTAADKKITIWNVGCDYSYPTVKNQSRAAITFRSHGYIYSIICGSEDYNIKVLCPYGHQLTQICAAPSPYVNLGRDGLGRDGSTRMSWAERNLGQYLALRFDWEYFHQKANGHFPPPSHCTQSHEGMTALYPEDYRDPREFACERITCGARVGEPCRTITGRPVKGYHVGRLKAAQG